MNRIDVKQITERLTERYGISLQATFSENEIDFRPVDLSPGNGFVVRLTKGWRSITAEFIPDNYAGHLIRTMGEADEQKKVLFCSMANAARTTNSTELLLRVNGSVVENLERPSWPNHWNQFELKLTQLPVIIEEFSPLEFQENIEVLSSKIFAMIICLIFLEERIIEESSIGLPEGSVSRVEVNRYERSALNREACIFINGCICKVCGFDFYKRYGIIGQGFIHVHHVVPLSNFGPGYIINPSTDLVPVCPNCHAMLHKKNPPYTVIELQQIIHMTTTQDQSKSE